MRQADFAGRRVGILGLGREGQAALEYLRSVCPGLELALICESPPDKEAVAQLGDKDRLITGPLSQAQLERFDLLVRSPGISPYRRSIQAAMKAGVEITTPSSLWFASHSGEKTICITGTKGKSTTSALLAHALSTCGYRVRLAGNIGRPLLSVVKFDAAHALTVTNFNERSSCFATRTECCYSRTTTAGRC